MAAERWWKFLGPAATAPFSGFRWPPPAADQSGGWVEADGPLDPCRRGLHLCRDADLPYWLGPELYAAEVDGAILEAGSFVIASRARLVRRVDAWNREAAVAFARGCSEATRAWAAEVRGKNAEGAADLLGYAEDAERLTTGVAEHPAWASRAASAALVAATAAAHASGSGSSWSSERARQSAWLVDHVLRTS